MGLFVALILFWMLILQGGVSGWKRWRKWRIQQPARYVSEIRNIDYYRRLTPNQFEFLVLCALKGRNFALLDDPFLGRSKKQGYAWKAGKKTVIVHHPENSLTTEELEQISQKLRAAAAVRGLVFYPYTKGPSSPAHDVTVLAGKKLLSWFSVLSTLPPPVPDAAACEVCECGSTMKQRVNRAGKTILVCGSYPDCRHMREPASVPEKNPPEASTTSPRLSTARLSRA